MSYINGIQQLGLGCENFKETWQWYIDNFGVNVRILEDDTVAERMLPYTGNKPQKRHACIAMNLQGGSGFEIWQYSERKPSPAPFKVLLGDLGVNSGKIRCRNVEAFHADLKAKGLNVSEVVADPEGKPSFWIRDPWGNLFQIVDEHYVYIESRRHNGGICGAVIGVSDIEKSQALYGGVLGYSQVVYDKTGVFADLDFASETAGEQYRRVLLERPEKVSTGPFGAVYGPSRIELVQVLSGREARKTFEGRYWGDPGFIQICFDVNNMGELKKYLSSKGYEFTVDSCLGGEVFDMGAASGHFTYIEDPDGTLIEFVQAHKIPLVEKLHLFIDIDKRGSEKYLPKILLRIINLTKIKTL